jgi:hypothetical protein
MGDVFNGCRVSLLQDKKVLEMGDCEGHMTV